MAQITLRLSVCRSTPTVAFVASTSPTVYTQRRSFHRNSSCFCLSPTTDRRMQPWVPQRDLNQVLKLYIYNLPCSHLHGELRYNSYCLQWNSVAAEREGLRLSIHTVHTRKRRVGGRSGRGVGVSASALDLGILALLAIIKHGLQREKKGCERLPKQKQCTYI